MSKPHTITVRLTEEQSCRLYEVALAGPYKIPVTEIVARGIELAATEIEAMRRAVSAHTPSIEQASS